jgi:alpha-1,3-rhamnosyl/mannosyltransferase
VNLLWCVPGRVGGSEQYLARQLHGLREIGADVELVMYASLAFDAAHPELSDAGRFVAAPTDGRRRWRRMVSESRWLGQQTRSVELVHHGGGTAPLGAQEPYVLTIHDLQYLTYPEHFSVARRRYLQAMMPRSARGASVVAVPTEYVRSTVVDRLDVAPARVVVVPHGYEPGLLRDVTPEAELRIRLGLGDGPVLVYPAITHPHKGHTLLVDLLAGPWRNCDLRLVLLGGRGAGERALVERIAAAPPDVAARIVRPGRVSDADRNGLLAMSTAMVFPSRYEGFGAPIIEAMALGAPVISSDATCLPEVVGDAGIVLPPTVEAWAGALDEVTARRDELVAAGAVRVEAFTSARSGEALEQAYRQAAGR